MYIVREHVQHTSTPRTYDAAMCSFCCGLQDALQQYTFLLFLAMMVVFTVFVFFKVPETKNLTFEEIAHKFSPGTNIEVEVVASDPAEDSTVIEEVNHPVQVTPETHSASMEEPLQNIEDEEGGMTKAYIKSTSSDTI